MKCPKCQNAELVQSSKVLGDSMAKYMEAVKSCPSCGENYTKEQVKQALEDEGLPAEVEKKL